MLDNVQELHEKMYEQSFMFLYLRSRPDCDVNLAETKERIMLLYRRIRSLA